MQYIDEYWYTVNTKTYVENCNDDIANKAKESISLFGSLALCGLIGAKIPGMKK